MTVFVLGATGRAGRLIVRHALSKGYSVKALVRSKARAADRTGVELAEGGARNVVAMKPHDCATGSFASPGY